MVADRAYSPASFACTDRQANLFYFAASVPAVGFVHGTVDLGPRDAVALASYAAPAKTAKRGEGAPGTTELRRAPIRQGNGPQRGIELLSGAPLPLTR